MKEDFKKFMEFAKTDESIQQKLKEAGQNYTGEQTEEAVFSAIIEPIAKEAGFNLGIDDIKQTVQEFNLDEMEQVAGGDGHGGWVCLVVGAGFGRHENTDDHCFIIGTGLGACLTSGATA